MNENKIIIAVGSKNPVKINAVKNAFSEFFSEKTIECIATHAPSLVSDQPMTEQETLNGAVNRVHFCQQSITADYYVAIEGGIDNFAYGPATFAYVVIANSQQESVGRSTNLPLPAVIYNALLKGEELGPVMDRFFGTTNIKQKGGAIGLLTNGLATRESTYKQSLILALSPFIYQKLYNQ